MNGRNLLANVEVKFCLLVNDLPLYLNVPARKSFEENFPPLCFIDT